MHHNLSHERDLCNFPADQNISLSPHVFLWVTSRENALNQHILQKRQMMTFESLMLIAQLLFFYPGRSGIVQISCDMSSKLNIWKALCGGKKIIVYIYMHFLSMPCHLKYKMVRGKKRILNQFPLLKWNKAASLVGVFLYCFFASAVFQLFCSLKKLLCVTRTLCSPQWLLGTGWRLVASIPKLFPSSQSPGIVFKLSPVSQNSVSR